MNTAPSWDQMIRGHERSNGNRARYRRENDAFDVRSSARKVKSARDSFVYGGTDFGRALDVFLEEKVMNWAAEWTKAYAAARTQIDSMSNEYDLLLEEALLPANWDHESALPVTGPAAVIASKVLFAISRLSTWRDTTVPDNISALGDGGLFMDWDQPNGRLELFISPDSKLTLVTVKKVQGADVDWSTEKDLSVDQFVSSLNAICNPMEAKHGQ